jgi:hypothetical protein
MDKWVLRVDGHPQWHTMDSNWHKVVRLSLRHFGVPDVELFQDDKIVSNKWLSFLRGRKDVVIGPTDGPVRGAGKTIPTEKNPIGFRMGNAEKVYPISILHMVYEDEPKSTYVTRESAEAAIMAAYNKFDGIPVGRWIDQDHFIAMLEDKPRQKVKAR